MKFNIGDKVSFIDENGGGIITRIINENIVHVEIEEGFEIPTAVSNLICISQGSGAKNSGADTAGPGQSDTEVSDYISPLYAPRDEHDISEEGIYFAIIPENQEKPLAGNLILYLLNYTDYQILYGLFTNESGSFSGFDLGYLQPRYKVNITTIERSKIDLWVNALAQVSFFKEGKTEVLQPMSQLINFKPVKTYKEDAFKYNNITRSKALIVKLGVVKDHITNPYLTKPVSESNLDLLKEKMTAEHKIEKDKPKTRSFLDKHKVDDKIAEVDLHIEKLVDDFTNLSNKDLINIQLDYFKRCIDQANKEKIAKVIFIHGIGNGILKHEIIKYLANIEGLQYYDASYSRYGMGATEVFFYRNK